MNRVINLIIDHILYDEFIKEDFFYVLSYFNILFLDVYGPLEKLNERKEKREDRFIGIAEQQYDFVHKGIKYDIEVNTYYESIKECVDKILYKFKSS